MTRPGTMSGNRRQQPHQREKGEVRRGGKRAGEEEKGKQRGEKEHGREGEKGRGPQPKTQG
eukprot:13806735-Heterocapsa_arctica.AAC.1